MKNKYTSETCEACLRSDHENCEVGISFLTQGIVKGVVCACRRANHGQLLQWQKQTPIDTTDQ